MADVKSRPRAPWTWIPSLYFAEGLPNALVATVSVIFYANLGLSNEKIALYTSLLYLPWVIKPIWSPLVDRLGTRRNWIWITQLLIAAGLAGIALGISSNHFFLITLIFFWLLAFGSATHDIAADGFYLLGATERQQSLYAGVRNTCYKVAAVTTNGLLVVLAGTIHQRTGDFKLAWSVTFGLSAVLFGGLALWHRFIIPRPAADVVSPTGSLRSVATGFISAFGTFFAKPGIVPMLAFLLLYRLGEAQLLKIVSPFMLADRATGGLGLDTKQVGWIYGTLGVIALMAGGLLGGFVISRNGLKFWLWPMLLIIHLPDTVFIYLAAAQPANLTVIAAGLAIEQFGYGFGFAAYMLYMIRIARGPHQTAHYAICTGFMALGYMLPGMWSGAVQSHLGYLFFFVWVLLSTIPSFIAAKFIPLEADFGKRDATP